MKLWGISVKQPDRFRNLRDVPKAGVGHKFGRLTVTGLALSKRHGAKLRRYWECTCDCGTSIDALDQSIRSGRTQSCGCLSVETRARTDGVDRTTRTYRSWADMLSRCRNPNLDCWSNYGGRGITVDPRWHDYKNFLADMGEAPKGLTIERKENDGNYEPGNCVWADMQCQQSNKRTSRLITVGDETLTVAAWCRRLNLPESRVRSRLRKGVAPLTALDIQHAC